jgi:hypothetical protein
MSISPYRAGSLAESLHEIGAGRRTMPTSNAKRHHLVPRFLLARFGEPPGARNAKLHQLDTQTATTQRVSVKVAATRHRFYAVESTESPQDNRIESLLSLVEHHAADSIARLLEAPETMDEFDQIDIAIFIALQVQRTPTSLKRTEELILQTQEEVLREHVYDPAAFARAAAEHGADLSPDQLEAERLKLVEAIAAGRLRAANLREEAWALIIDNFLEAGEHPLRMRWLLLRAKKGEFIVSDRGYSAIPLEGEGVETAIPLASDACLLLLPGSDGINFIEIDASEVEMINLRTYGWAERFAFARREQTLIDLQALAEGHPERVPKN